MSPLAFPPATVIKMAARVMKPRVGQGPGAGMCLPLPRCPLHMPGLESRIKRDSPWWNHSSGQPEEAEERGEEPEQAALITPPHALPEASGSHCTAWIKQAACGTSSHHFWVLSTHQWDEEEA